MKNYLFSILFLCIANVNSQAIEVQDSTSKEKLVDFEVSLGVGSGSHSQLYEGGRYSYDDYEFKLMPISSYSGTYNFNGRIFFLHKLAIGVTIAYENEKGITQVKDPRTEGSPLKSGDFRRNVYTFALEILVNYSSYERRLVNFYGYFGYGQSYINEVRRYDLTYYNTQYKNGVNTLGDNLEVSGDRKRTPIQICPLGISVGRTLRGFLEIGYGYKGIINVGVAAKF